MNSYSDDRIAPNPRRSGYRTGHGASGLTAAPPARLPGLGTPIAGLVRSLRALRARDSPSHGG